MNNVITESMLEDVEVVPRELFRNLAREPYRPSGSRRLESLRRKYLRVAVYACYGVDEPFQATSVALLKQPFEALFRNTPKWTPRGFFIDQTGRDAAISKRPMFNRMFDDGAFDLIICKSISHLHTPFNLRFSFSLSCRSMTYSCSITRREAPSYVNGMS